MPYESVSLGDKFAIRLEQLTARDVLVITCATCHRRWDMPPHRLLEHYHAYVPITSIEKDMKCRRCGVRTEIRWHVMRTVEPNIRGRRDPRLQLIYA